MSDYTLRRSQLIAPFGVGAIVNMPKESLITCSVDYWEKTNKLFDERLQKRLKVKYFITPPPADKSAFGVQFARFPRWLLCRKCHNLREYSTWNKRAQRNGRVYQTPRCDTCKIDLIPIRFIVACPSGHVDDFPWRKWVHQKKSKVCENSDLLYQTRGTSAGLDSIYVKCKECGAEENMGRSFKKGILKDLNIRCEGNMPWCFSKEECGSEELVTLQRGASNVYFPKIVSSIIIPPYSDDICIKIKNTAEWGYLCSAEGGVSESIKNDFISKIADQVNLKKKQATELIERMLSSPFGEIESDTEEDYRFDEYKAFLGAIEKGRTDSKQFSIDIRNNNKYGIKGLKNIVLVKRLRELRALVSFSRLKPLERDYLGIEDDQGLKHKPVNVRHKPQENKFYPAIEVNGEGIFLAFDYGKLHKWSQMKDVKDQFAIMGRNYVRFCSQYEIKQRKIDPIFVLLHAFSHILIRQLSFECGYSSASLRERIYYGMNMGTANEDMAGILVYTASGDSEGTLGGLVRQGQEDRLPAIIERAVDQASWCSSDPVCIESKGQGMFALNLGACHACALLPETSCEEGNRFLDRSFIVGLKEKPDIGFFSDFLNS